VNWIDDETRRLPGLSQEDKWRIAWRAAQMTPQEAESVKRLVDESVAAMQLRLNAVIQETEGAKK
jgi:hypothetical protein